MTMQAATPAKRRPRRIAADEAHAWARNLRLGNPYAKLVLSMLTIYVNGDGSCFVSIAQLAEDCELAENTIRRRLTFLEQVGAIAKFSQWRDDHGRMNAEGRGRRTTDDIRLLVNADPDEIEARAAGNVDRDEADDSAPSRGSPGEPQIEGAAAPQNPVSPSLGVHLPSHCGQGLTSEPEPELKKDSPPYPPPGGNEADSNLEQEASEAAEVEGWQEFKTTFESDGEPISRVSIAKQLFSALSWPDERKRVTKAAKGLIVWRSRQKKLNAKLSAQTLIREPDSWSGWEAHAPPDPPPPKPKTELAADTNAFAAYALARAIARMPPLKPDTPSILFIGEVPKGAASLAALARFKPGTFEVDNSDWTLAAKGTPRYVAWCERVQEWIHSWPEEHRYWLDEHDSIVPTYKDAFTPPGKHLPKCCDGLLLPPTTDGWPPPKGATGPPD